MPVRKTPLIGAPEPIAALNRVKILEKTLPYPEREALVDIRTFCPDIIVVETVCPFLRQHVAEKLNAAQALLTDGRKLKAHTALRTLGMQKRGWDNYHKKMQEEHPEWPLSALRRATNKYFAPYDQPAPPGHCTGAAVDVSLLDAEGNLLDLIAPTTGWEAAYTWSDKLSPESKQNRMIMVNAMLGAGFSNCRDEYWHYSWGDSAWAVRVGETTCPYGWAHPPVELVSHSDTIEKACLQIQFERDAEGRVVSAAGEIALPESGEWRIGLLWAHSVPTTLHLHLPQPNLPTPELFHETPAEEWSPLEVIREGDSLTLSLTPEVDRFSLANFVPPPPPPSTS